MGKASDYRVTVRVIGEPSKEALFRVYENLVKKYSNPVNTSLVGPIGFADVGEPQSQLPH